MKLILRKSPGGGWSWEWRLGNNVLGQGWTAGRKADAIAEAEASKPLGVPQGGPQ